VRAILVSDIHLQAKPPVARSAEPDWFAAMARPLTEVADLAEQHDCPVFYAGDIFDRWDARPEIVNFALAHLPDGYAIPGQHDLPYHDYQEIKRSAYWTLVEAAKLVNLVPAELTQGGASILAWPDLIVYGFPWGHQPEPIKPIKGTIQLAIVHGFIWQKGTGYPGASVEAKVGAYRERLQGYTAAAFGDNHKGFLADAGGVAVCNCGGLMRRHTDERDYQPGVGLLHADGSITRHYLDTTEDQFIETTEAEEVVEQVLDMSAFVTGLRELGADDALDFLLAVERFLQGNEVSDRAQEIILAACGEGD